MDKLLTYADIARLAGVKLGTVQMWHKRGILPERSPETVGRRPVFNEGVILEWLQASGRGHYIKDSSDQGE